jgi:hypothetical protein
MAIGIFRNITDVAKEDRIGPKKNIAYCSHEDHKDMRSM